MNPQSTPVTIPATDGLALGGRLYEAGADRRFDALLLPGIGVPQRAFRHLGRWLAARGVRAVSVDYRGMGESRLRAQASASASLSAWATHDAVGALRFVERTGGGAPVLVIGHSFGGQALGFSDEFRRASAAILVCSQFGQARHWDGFERVKVTAFWHAILPLAAGVFDVVPGWTGIGEAIPRGVAREWARWGRSPDWLLSHVDGAKSRYAAFDRPVRAYAVSDDPIAPPRAVTALLSRFETAPLERVDVAPSDLGLRSIGHLGLFRPGPAEAIWQQFLEFGTHHADARG